MVDEPGSSVAVWQVIVGTGPAGAVNVSAILTPVTVVLPVFLTPKV